MESRVESKRLIILFIVIAYGASAIGDFIWFKSGMAVHPAAFITILAPTIAAVSIYFISGKKVKVNLSKCSFKEIILCIGIPIIYFSISYIIYILFTGNINAFQITIKDIFILIIQFIFMGILEEVGWRGVLLPLMQKVYIYKKAIIFNGLVWAFWHYPMILGGMVSPYLNSAKGIVLFTIEVLLITAIMGNLQRRLNMFSIWPLILLHAVHNIMTEIILGNVGIEQGIIVGDSGYIVVFVIAVIAVLLVWRYEVSNINKGENIL